MTKRVLIFSLAYLPRTIGGAEIAIKEITDRIDVSDIEFHMITNRYDSTLPKIERVGNIVVHRIGFSRQSPTMADLRRFPLHLNKYLYQITAALYALRLQRRYRYDGVWAMMAHATGPAVALFNIFNPRVPYVLTLQEGDPIEHIERTMKLVWPLFVRAFTRATVVHSISQFLASWGERRGARVSAVIPNGVHLERFNYEPSNEERYELRQKVGVSASEVMLITVSRLVSKNGIDTVIDALQFLPNNVVFVVLGDGPLHASLVSRAHQVGVSDRVRLLGEKSQDDIVRHLRVSDVFIRASRSEGQGISFIEAMAAGVPTVGTAVGGIPEFLLEGKTGYIALPEDPKSVADAVARAVSDPDTERVRSEAKKLVMTTYDWVLITKRMRTEVFESLFDGVRIF